MNRPACADAVCQENGCGSMLTMHGGSDGERVSKPPGAIFPAPFLHAYPLV